MIGKFLIALDFVSSAFSVRNGFMCLLPETNIFWIYSVMQLGRKLVSDAVGVLGGAFGTG